MNGCDVCPVCHTPVPTSKTHNLPLREPLNFRGSKIVLHRLREKICPTCGNRGGTDVFIGRTVWEREKSIAD